MFDYIEELSKNKLVLFIISTCLFAYFFFMFVVPIFNTNYGEFNLSSRWDSLMDTLYRWQTFNASVLAFIASILVIFSTTISERRTGRKKRKAQLAFLPQALSQISTYIEDFANTLDVIQKKNGHQAQNLPKIPDSALNRIEKFIEVSDHKDELIVKHLVIVTHIIQIYDSRLNSLINDKSIINKEQRAFSQIGQCVKTYCLISGMYGFARDEKKHYKVTSLDANKLSGNKLPCYMTDQEMIDISNQEICLQLFCND